MTEIYLIRHGQAEGNVMRRFHGHYNSSLTPMGFRQVELLKKRFDSVHVDACYSSDLTRTSFTAQSVYLPKRLPLQRDYRFREMGIGTWDDIPCGWLYRFYGDHFSKFDENPETWRVPGSETFDEYTQRFIEGMKEAAENNDGGTITIFCHAAIIRRVMLRLFFWNDRQKLGYADNTSVSRIYYQKGEFMFDFMNDSTHLTEDLTSAHFQKWWREAGKKADADLYFLPYRDNMPLPPDLMIPDRDSRGLTLTAMLHDTPVGIVSMAAPDGFTGSVIGMSLKDEYLGRHYGDQLLGSAISHFRHLGCRELELMSGCNPDNILVRYGFDLLTQRRNIDTEHFDWGTPNA